MEKKELPVAAVISSHPDNPRIGENKDKKNRRFGAIGIRMKGYEGEIALRIDEGKPFMLRLDGHKFSTFTRPFKKPYDVRIHNAMVRTTCDLVDHFHCILGFTCSDEMTLIFPLLADEETGVLEQHHSDYSGKIQKLVSLSSSFASVRFNRHLNREDFALPAEKKLLEHIERHAPHFDSRIFVLPNNEEIVNNLIWRARIDYRRNSISTFARSHFSQKQLHGVNTKTMLAMTLAKGAPWDGEPAWYRFGTFIKKEKIEKDGTDRKTGKKVRVVRTRTTARCIELTREFSADQMEWIIARYWPPAIMAQIPLDPVDSEGGSEEETEREHAEPAEAVNVDEATVQSDDLLEPIDDSL